MYMYWQWQIYQTWGLAASGSRSRNLKRSYPACPKNKKPNPMIKTIGKLLFCKFDSNSGFYQGLVFTDTYFNK